MPDAVPPRPGGRSALKRASLGVLAGAVVTVTIGACGPGPRPSTTRPSTPTVGASTTTSGPNLNATETPPPGDIPDTQTFVGFTPPAAGYTIKVPEGWSMTASGASVMFADKFNRVVLTAGSSTAPTVTSVRVTDLPAIRAASPGYVAGTVSTVHRRAGSVVLATYRADSAPNDVTGKVVLESVERYAFWRAGRQVVVTVSAPVGSDNVDAWRTITDSLRWTG